MTDAVGGRSLKIDLCKMDGCKYRRKVDLDDEMVISVARRMSFSRIFAQHSMAWVHNSLEKLPIRLTLSNVGIMAVILAILMPRSFTYMLVYPIFRLVFGTLYPAYASYKGIRTKNVKEYVKWMMYWIVFALFTCAETFTDVFFSFWFPFYYEIKIILVLWLLSPATNGSSILYRRFVHPALSRREAEIDEALARATEQGYTAVLHLGSRGVNYATTVLMQTAIKNLPNVSPNATKSILPASQSESALSSLASPKETPPKESKKDSPDGVRTRRRRIKSDNNPVVKIESISSTTDPSTDEDFELENEIENENDQALIQDPDFKVPKKRARKPKKERARSTSRKRKTRSTKDDKSDPEFSDVVDFD